MDTRDIIFDELIHPILFFGEKDNHIRKLEKVFLVNIFPKKNGIEINGESSNLILVEKILNYLWKQSQKGIHFNKDDLNILINQVKEDKKLEFNDELNNYQIYIPKSKQIIKPKTVNQMSYIKAIKKNDLIFGIGPAGTGKTYIAVALAINALLENSIKKIILTRPVVEAGESLGYLPGDLYQKINPYLRPLFDAICDMISYEDFIKLKEKERIEIVPLAYMRGRTLNQSFIILDEAQNTTMNQLKMFLTRLGPKSKTIITGDLTQIDLNKNSKSGLSDVIKLLKSIKGISCNYFNEIDIVRHPLIRKIIFAFEKNEQKI